MEAPHFITITLSWGPGLLPAHSTCLQGPGSGLGTRLHESDPEQGPWPGSACGAPVAHVGLYLTAG